MKIKKGDKVKILSGKDRGKIGKVVRIDYKNQTLVVAGLNLFKKHRRPRKQDEKGEIVSIEKPIVSSKVMVICPSCGKASRSGYRFENNNKLRYCKKCKATWQ